MLSILLRGLLCISLILNGSGYAMASTHAQMGHMGRVVSMQEPEATAEPPCHQQAETSTAAVGGLPDAVHDESGAKSKHPSPDCCKSGACRCACVHQAQAALPVQDVRHDMAEHASGARPLKPGHPAPALPHLIRPPIG